MLATTLGTGSPALRRARARTFTRHRTATAAPRPGIPRSRAAAFRADPASSESCRTRGSPPSITRQRSRHYVVSAKKRAQALQNPDPKRYLFDARTLSPEPGTNCDRPKRSRVAAAAMAATLPRWRQICTRGMPHALKQSDGHGRRREHHDVGTNASSVRACARGSWWSGWECRRA